MPLPSRRARQALLLLAVVAAAACSGTARRQARLRSGLEDYRYPRTPAEIWPEVLKLLDEKGYQLVGDDRAALGLPKRNILLEAVSAGFDTRTKPGGGRILETNANKDGLRMRVEAYPMKDGGTKAIFTRLRRDDTGPLGSEEERDVELELQLVQRLDPVAAARIEGVAPPPAAVAAAAPAAAADPWQPLRPLVGTWEAPAAAGLPAVRWTFDVASAGQRMEFHGTSPLGPKATAADAPEEMGVITRDQARGKLVWRQFTGSGQVNEYLLEKSDPDRLVFVAEKAEALPAGSRLRLTLGRDGEDELVAVFELAEPGKDLAVTAETRLKRRR